MKRIFISFFIFLLAFGFITFLYLTVVDRNLAYAGGLVSSLGGVLYFSGIYTFYKTSNNIATARYFGLIIYTGLILVLISLYSDPEPLHYTALAYSALAMVCWEQYLNWYSNFGSRDFNFKIDQKLPKGELLDLKGKTIKTETLLKTPSVWLFFRGNWCPFCTVQVEELAKEYQSIKAAGFQINFVSNQSVNHNISLAEKLNVEANFLTDESGLFAESMGLVDKSGLPVGLEVFGYNKDVLYPAILITGNKGRVLYFDITDNYRDRPESSIILEEIKSLQN